MHQSNYAFEFSLLMIEYILTFYQSFADMSRPKVEGRNMPPKHIRAANFRKSVRKAETLKKEGTSRRISPVDPNVPLWARGFVIAIYAFKAQC